MVKPTLKPESEKEKKEDALKDDKLKEWGILPAAVVIDETEKENDKKDAEAAITELENLETDYDDGSRPMIVKFCACFAVFTILLIVTCTIGSFIYFHYGNSGEHKWKGWCSVKYGDDGINDQDSGEKGPHGSQHGGRSSSEEGGRGRHHNPLYPRPTGPPGGRRCNQESQVDVENQLERVERPEEEDCERLTILHDYNANISAYRLWNSEVCYVTWIEQEVLMDPEEFWTNMQDPEYLNQYFSELTLTYRAVLPAIPKPLHEQENGKYGEYLDGPKDFLCQGAETYWIEKIPEEEIEAFMELVNQIMEELMALAAAADEMDADDEQQEEEWPQHYPGTHQGMPFPGDEEGRGSDDMDEMPEFPWGDGPYAPMGGRPGWPGDHDMPDSDRHHDGDREHGMRKRRNAGKDVAKDKTRSDVANIQDKTRSELQQASDCFRKTQQKLTEVAGKHGQGILLSAKVYGKCIMERMSKM